MRQLAMALDLRNNKTIRDDIFERIDLEKSPQKALEIFNKFDGGGKLFPNDILSKLEYELKKDCAYISNEAIMEFSQKEHKNFHKIKTLISHNSNLKIKKNYISPIQKLQENMHNEITNEIIPWLVEKISWRRTSKHLET